MELLILLAERKGELVTREEIAERLWGKDVFLDVEHGINTAIRKIRLVLRDDPEHPHFVETVVGKGYRFAAPVTYTNGSPAAVPALSPAPETSSPAASPAIREKSRAARLALLAGIVVAGVLSTAIFVRYRRTTAPPAIKSLAVLPLKNLSGDPAQDYFADGMTEELIGRLSNIHGLNVISRTSVMRFKDTRQTVPEIAQTLHVDAIVEGSVIREGDRVRVNAQLIRAATDQHLWAAEYNREYRSILALQEDLAQTIARQIKVTMAPHARADDAAISPEAYENYLKGRYYFSQRTGDALKRSIGYFQQAIAADPNYALAYCGLADAYALLGFRGAVPSRDTLAQAKEAALKAIELDDTLGEPHASLAFIAETHEWDWAAAEREYKRALELDPGDARAHHWYAGYLMYVGRFDEGIAEARRARELDPLSMPINNALAGRLLVAGRYDEALAQVRTTLDIDPHFAPAHQTLGWAYLRQGKNEEAIREFQQAVESSGNTDLDLTLDLGFAYATVGRRDDAVKILDALKRQQSQGLVPAAAIGILYGALGDLDQAFNWLQKGYAERDPELTYLKVPGRRYEPLRHDPRFQQLVERMHFPN
jgi:TolB-like protein/DNA-binding winged helix-turn-helix (wHTH) protein/Flp pilus assembly protein TadD